MSLATAAMIVPATSAIAQVTFTGRSVVAKINTTKADFSDAVLTLDATTFVKATAPGTRSLNFQPLAGFAGGTYTTTGGITLSGYTADPSGASANVLATSDGSFTFHNTYTTGVDDPFANATLLRYTSAALALPPFTNPSLPVAEFYLPGLGAAGLVDMGGTFFFSLTIPGNYSTTAGLASHSGQHAQDPDYTYFSGFSVQKDYAYDSATNTTTLSLSDNNVQPNEDFIALDTYFLGSAVSAAPEPSTWAMMILGLAGVGVVMRRRNRASGASEEVDAGRRFLSAQ